MDIGFHGNLVIVCGRIDAHPTDAIATPSHELPSKSTNSMPTTFGPRIICASDPADKISVSGRGRGDGIRPDGA
jgi:hypothetical protein